MNTQFLSGGEAFHVAHHLNEHGADDKELVLCLFNALNRVGRLEAVFVEVCAKLDLLERGIAARDVPGEG